MADFKVVKHTGRIDIPSESVELGGTVEAGDMLSRSSGTAIKTTNNQASTELLGIAQEAGVLGDVIQFVPLTPGLVLEGAVKGTIPDRFAYLGIDVTSNVQKFEFAGNLAFQVYKIVDASALVVQATFNGVGADQAT